MIKIIYAFIVGLIGALIVHITILFMVPSYAQDNAWNYLLKDGGVYRFFDISATNPIRQSSDPLFALKACRFDLSDGPVHIKANPTGDYWSMSVYERSGNNLYSLNKHTTPNDTLDLTIGTPIQVMEIKQIAPDYINNSVLLNENISRGFIIIRNYDGANTQTHINHAFLNDAECKTLEY